MRSLGYGPDGGLKVKVSARNIVWNHDPAAIPMDLLKEIWIDGELGRLKLPTGSQSRGTKISRSP
jgi:hypothetical protein